MGSREAPERTPPGETATAVRVVVAPAVAVVPRALGYGNVQPEKVWEAVAEVDGRIVEVHPQLKKGAILPAGAVLLRIDPTKYRLAVSQIAASLRSMEAKLAELRVRAANTRASLAIEERSLALGRKDLERKRRLLATKNISQAAVDQEERGLLGGQQNAQSLRNTLNLIPAEPPHPGGGNWPSTRRGWRAPGSTWSAPPSPPPSIAASPRSRSNAPNTPIRDRCWRWSMASTSPRSRPRCRWTS